MTTDDSAPILRVDDIEVVYGQIVLALRGVTLSVPRGAIVALLGANGAGKTTTLKAVSGLLEAERGELTRGKIVYKDKLVARRSPRELVRDRTGTGPRRQALLPQSKCRGQSDHRRVCQGHPWCGDKTGARSYSILIFQAGREEKNCLWVHFRRRAANGGYRSSADGNARSFCYWTNHRWASPHKSLSKFRDHSHTQRKRIRERSLGGAKRDHRAKVRARRLHRRERPGRRHRQRALNSVHAPTLKNFYLGVAPGVRRKRESRARAGSP